MPRRVLYLNHVGAVSGAEQSLLVLLRALPPDAVAPTLLCPAGPLADRAAAIGVRRHDAPAVRLRRQVDPDSQVRTIARFGGLAATILGAAIGQDLLHANSLTTALAALPARRLLGRPLVWHVRDLRLPRRAVRLLAGVDAAVAISSAVADRLRELGFPTDRIHRIPNAIDPSEFAPRRPAGEVRAELGLDQRDEVVVLVGQKVPWKGHDLLLDAIARLTPRRPRLRVVLIGADLFGEHPDHAARLAALASGPALAGRVLELGYRTDIPDLLAAADLLVCPSRGEPFGRVLLEAMAASKPVVATVPGGARDIVSDGRTGRLVPQDDPAALAAAIEAVLADPVGAAAMGRAGRARVERAFAPAAHARAVTELYDRLEARRER